MMEISLTELMLLVWAVAASAGWWHMRDEERKAKFLLRQFIEDDGVREQVLAAFKRFKEGK